MSESFSYEYHEVHRSRGCRPELVLDGYARSQRHRLEKLDNIFH